MKSKKKATKKVTQKELANDLGVSVRTLQRNKKKATLTPLIVKKATPKIKRNIEESIKEGFFELIDNLSNGLKDVNFNKIKDKDKVFLALQFMDKMGRFFNKNDQSQPQP